MTRAGKRKTSHHTGSSARRVIRRRVRFMKLSLSKMSDLQKRGCEDMRVRVLLKNTYYGLKNSITTQFPSWAQGASVPQPRLPEGPLSPVGKHHRQDGGMAPEPTVPSPRPPNAGDLPSNAFQALVSNLEEEEQATSFRDHPQQELHCDPSFGNFPIQTTTSLQGQEDLFPDIEMSEFESILVPVPNGRQLSEEGKADPQPEAKPLSGQKESGMADLEHFVELLIDVE